MQVLSVLRTPSGLNGAASLVAQQAVPGLRASTSSKLSNLDCTGLRIVKRGCVVEFPGGATARVSKVRLGVFHVDVRVLGTGFRFHSCRSVRVVA